MKALREYTHTHTHTHTHGYNYLKNKKIVENLIIYFILAIISILQIILIFNNNVWGDEAFTMIHVKEDWATLGNILINDVHPPLYYIILKVVMSIIGYNLQVAKIVSLLPIFILNIYIINKTLKSEKIINIKKDILLVLFLLVTNLSSNFMYINLEVRMYSWASFFVTMSGICAYKVYKSLENKDIVLFIIMSLGAALTHYFALIMEIVIYIYLFIALYIKNKNNIKKIINITFYTIIGYIWWFPIAVRQFVKVQHSFWITFSAKDIIAYIKGIIGANFNNVIIIIFVIIGIEIINVIVKLIKRNCTNKEKEDIIFSICSISLPFVIIIIGTLFNIWLTPIFVFRYITPALCLFWLGVINLLNYISCKKIIISILAILMIFLSIVGYKNKYNEEMATGTEKLLNFMDENCSKTDTLMSNIWDLSWSVLEYYFPENEVKLYGRDKLDLNKENIIWLFENKRRKYKYKKI